ncbi:RNA exonuclease 1 homolog [Haemaphysalis longicornis]
MEYVQLTLIVSTTRHSPFLVNCKIIISILSTVIISSNGSTMADELVLLVFSAVVSVLIFLVIFMTEKKESGVKQDPLEATKDVEMVEEEKPQYLNSCPVRSLKEHSGTPLDLNFEGNAQCPATSPDGPSPQHATAATEGGRQKALAPIIASATPRCPIPLNGASHPSPCADELYQQILNYRLTPSEMYRCGYPRPVPDKPGRAVWWKSDGDEAYSSRKTCCRCGATFFITPGGEYYAQNGCRFHPGRRWGGVFSCCQAALEHPGCESSDYHVCAEGLPRKRNTLPRGFVRTRLRPGIVGGVFAVDCEMCFTIRGLEVAKVCVVSWDGATVFETYVRPTSPVLDYNTSFSGVTAEHLSNVQTTLKDVQKVLLRLFTASTVLVGHGLENDLRVLKLIHDTVVDTAMLFPHRQGLPYRRSLRSLVNSYLHRDVQAGPLGHDCAEDARACMELVLWKAASDLNQLGRFRGEAAG